MAKMNISSKEQACFYLGVRINASEEEIKKAYHEKVKMYHPDNGGNLEHNELFYYIQQSYEWLVENANKEHPIRPVRVFQTNTSAKRQFQKQKQTEKERENLRQWENNHKKDINVTPKKPFNNGTAKELSKEEETLNKIRAIWLAETIHRQIEREKEQAELENKRKMYRAFMQQQMHEKNDYDEIK